MVLFAGLLKELWIFMTIMYGEEEMDTPVIFIHTHVINVEKRFLFNGGLYGCDGDGEN